MKRRIGGWIGYFMLFAASAYAQHGYSAAEGTTSLVDWNYSALSVDVKDAGLTLQLIRGQSETTKATRWSDRLAISAQKGRRDLFAKGSFVPGIELEERRLWRWNFDSTRAKAQYTIIYVGVGGEIAERKVAAIGPGTSPLIALDARTGTTVSASLGAVQTFDNTNWRVGAQVNQRWHHDVPTSKKMRTVSIETTTGVDATGTPVRLSETSERFVGPVGDFREFVARIDVMGPAWLIAKDNDIPEVMRPSVAMLAAVSVSTRPTLDEQWNVSLGPALFAPGNGTAMLGALLFEATDLGNAAGDAPKFSDKFGVRLIFGVPFK